MTTNYVVELELTYKVKVEVENVKDEQEARDKVFQASRFGMVDLTKLPADKNLFKFTVLSTTPVEK